MTQETRTYKKEIFETYEPEKIESELNRGDRVQFSNVYFGNVIGFFNKFGRSWFNKPYIEVGKGCEKTEIKTTIRGIERFFLDDMGNGTIIRETPISEKGE
tara:strand:- start:574 stop:876 length:303 start_codon:yes stop_codon:yes gene_type:complete